MNKAKKHVYYDYIADMEAKYNDGRSNRTLVAELSGKERASERLLYKAVARIVTSLYDRWNREKHAALDTHEHKTLSCEPELIVYPDGSKKFACTMHITHSDFSVVAAELPSSLQLQTKKHPFTAQSIEAFTDTFASGVNTSERAPDGSRSRVSG